MVLIGLSLMGSAFASDLAVARVEAHSQAKPAEEVVRVLADLLNRKDESWVWVLVRGEKFAANILRTEGGTLKLLVQLQPLDKEARARVLRFFGRLNVKPETRKTWVGPDFHEVSQVFVAMDFGRDAHRAARVAVGLLDEIRGASSDFAATAELHCKVDGHPTTQCP